MAQQKSEKQDHKPTELPAQDNARMREKADMIMAKLAEFYPQAPKGFLDHKDPFTLLVAVVLSAQCLDSTVNAVTPALFAAADTPEKMRDLGVAKIQQLIQRIGLSASKSKYLAGLSAAICADHNGAVPDSLEALEQLPGVGRKTASVVLIQAFGNPAFPVDTHIHRLACRWGAGHARSVEKTEATLKQWFPDPSSWADLHVRIIAFGREHCPARNHDMDTCPICSFAATNEARAANRSSPGKFVAPKAHKNPYSIRTSDGTGPILDRVAEAPLKASAAHAAKRARKPTPAKTESFEQHAEYPSAQESSAEDVSFALVSPLKRQKNMKGAETAEKKTTPVKKGRGIAKPPAAASSSSAAKKDKKPGRAKGPKSKTEKPKPKEPEGVRRSARIASQQKS